MKKYLIICDKTRLCWLSSIGTISDIKQLADGDKVSVILITNYEECDVVLSVNDSIDINYIGEVGLPTPVDFH